MNGYRLDRRSAALGGVVRSNIVPGSSESSRLFRRVSGSQFGPQMPPAGPLSPDEVAVLKRWIDEGAQWPDVLANEADVPSPDPLATRLIEAIRQSDREAAFAELAGTPSVVNKRGPEGATPLMYAALYGDVALVAKLLQAGADPNTRNHVDATPLMWGLENLEIVQLLLDGGANVNAISAFGRTPLMLAAAQAASAPLVKLLLDRGARPNQAALTSAASRGDAAVVRLLLAAGARDGGAAAAASLRVNCRECWNAISASQEVTLPKNVLLTLADELGNPEVLREAIAHGADVNVRDARSRSVLMLAATAETISPASLKLLIDHGADVHMKSADGRTALDFARLLGETPAVKILLTAGATTTPAKDPPRSFVPAKTTREAVLRSLPLLQRTSIQFYKKSGCVSCHNNSLTQITVAAARRKHFSVNEVESQQDLDFVVRDIEATRDQALQGIVTPGGGAATTGYILMGLWAQNHQPDAATDALVRLLKLRQRSDGRWDITYRPPSESSEFTATAVSLRGLRLYGRRRGNVTYDDTIRAAVSWLENARPRNNEDRVFRLLGLTWGGAPDAVRTSAVKDLLVTQRPDGGWAQLTSLQSDAYATGQALVALNEAGMSAADPSYKRGVQFLLNTQLADGSWFVRKRAHASQIYFESGFPHGDHQYISSAATNWATHALILAQ
jgi:ankyrin repeat protein